MIEFHLLGSLEAVEDGGPVGLGAPRQRALLAMLLIHRERTVSADALIDALWDDHPPPSALKIVQGYVSSLRRTLGEPMITTEGHGYRLHLAPDQTDADRFEQLLLEGQNALGGGQPAAAAATLREALGLWRGPALADLGDDRFAQPEIARLEELRLTALEQRIEAELALGHHARVIGELQGLVQAHPLREAFTAQLMLALYRAGRQADALDSYRQTRTRLIDELGLEPGPSLRERQSAILAHDGSLLYHAAPELDPGPSPRPDAQDRPPARGRRRVALLTPAVVVGALLVVLAFRALGAHRDSAARTRPNSVIAIDVHTNRVTGVVGVGARPGAIAAGAGSLWVANRDDQTISQVNPKTLAAIRTVAVSDAPQSVAEAGGRVWVAGADPAAPFVSVDAIDPHFDTIAQMIRIPTVFANDSGVIAARGSSVWVAATSAELTNIDAHSGRVVRRIDPNGGPTAIGMADDGEVWMADDDADDVFHVDRAGTVNTIPVGHDPSAIAVGAGGVWVTDTGDDAVIRINPATRSVMTTIHVGNAPHGIAVGDGSIWVANSGDGTVSRIDPGSDRVIATVRVGASPQDIAVDGPHVWVTVDTPAADTGTSAPEGAVRVVSNWDVSFLDPAQASDSLSTELLYSTCAELLNYPDRSGAASSRLVPEVAQSLPIRSANGRTYTFTIRRGFRFSPPSGAPVTAQTFKYTIERVLDPRTRSPYANDYLDIVGARAFHAGRTAQLAGVVARGHRLIIHLTAAAPDLPARMAQPAMCVVPTDTPITPQGVRIIPSAGPYRVASYAPGQGIVLTRNPNYHGTRPRRPSRIIVQVGIPADRAIAEVEDGAADYAPGLDFTPAQVAALARRYSPGSAAARAGRQRYFATPSSDQLDFFALNTHRPLFSHLRLRQAVNEAIDRGALARLGDYFEPLPEHPTSLYLPPGIPGYRDVAAYPNRPDLSRARALARGFGGSAVRLLTCDVAPCGDQAEIVKRNLAAIGLRVHVEELPENTLFTEEASPHARFDMAWSGWIPDYLDPGAMLNQLLETNTAVPSFVSPRWRARLDAAARLAGTRRDLTYARLDLELARDAAPLVAFGNLSQHDFFSARTRCQTFGPYGVDLGALCLKHAG